MTADGVDFVDEDDARSVLLALLEQVADAACAHADEHLHEVGARDAEERNVGFAGYRTGQQGLAGSGRADQQHALGNASAQLLELLRFAQELDNLLELFLGFIHAGNVFERHLLLLHGEQARPALAERQRFVPASLHLADHDEPQCAQQDERRQVQQPGWPAAGLSVLHRDVDALVAQFLDHVGVAGHDCSVEAGLVVLELASDFLANNRHFADVALVHLGEELREIDFAIFRSRVRALDDLPQQNAREHDHEPEHDRFDRRIH